MNTKYAAEIWILQTQILLKLPTKMPIYGGNRRYANFAEICKKNATITYSLKTDTPKHTS